MRRRVCVVGDLIGVYTVREAEDDLHVGTACLTWEGGARPGAAVLGPVAVAPPRYGRDLLVDVGLRLGAGITRYSTEVPWEWYLRMVDLLVVSLECCGIDLGVVVAVDVVKGRSPLGSVSWQPV